MNLPEGLTRAGARTVLILQKNAPHIFFGAGIVGGVASTVLACRATLKLSETLDDIKGEMQDIHNHKIAAGEAYPDQQFKKDLAYVYVQGGLKLGKLYGPATIVGVASIAALSGSHIQLTRRNAALMAAYAALQNAYDEYRSRVRDELGDEKELELYHAIETSVKKGDDIKTADPNKWSTHAVFFDEYNKNWEKDPELNRLFVQCQQNYANQLLRTRGHIFLNEVYDMLGAERSKAGSILGWVISKDGNNFVDFGIYEARSARFVNGTERSIILDFNIDGVIFDKI